MAIRLLLVAWALVVGGGPVASANTIAGSIRVEPAQGGKAPDPDAVVVFLEGNDVASSAALKTGAADGVMPHISHKGVQFSPRVLPVAAGTTVDFLNDDGVFHNAFSLSKAAPFDLGIYPQGTSRVVTFDTPGLVRVYCNIHPDMVANVLVLQNRHFDVTEGDGIYRLMGIPDGNYTLRAWAEYADAAARVITVWGGGVVAENFVLTARRQFAPHRNKFGKPYRKKY